MHILCKLNLVLMYSNTYIVQAVIRRVDGAEQVVHVDLEARAEVLALYEEAHGRRRAERLRECGRLVGRQSGRERERKRKRRRRR